MIAASSSEISNLLAAPHEIDHTGSVIAFAAMANTRVTPSAKAKAAKAKAVKAKTAKPRAKAAKAKPKASQPTKARKATAKTGGGNRAARITSRHFGAIAAEMETTLARGGEPLLVDVNLADPAAFTQTAVDALDRAVDEIEQRDVAARAAFAAAMSDDQAQPLLFWRFHHDEVEGHENLERDTFAATLRLGRVGFYPDGAFDSTAYVVLDFAVPGPQTDQLLVAKFRADGSLVEIAWES